MESDSESKIKDTDSTVKSLQAALFPPQLTCSGSYFSNFLLKCQYEEEDESKYKVKETSSKDWCTVNKDISFTLQPPRWPTECQVLEERVKHISYVPPSLEPYYIATGNECQPKPTGDECGIIVYQYTPISAVNYFSRSSVGGSNYLLSTNLCPEQDTLKFESRFESANLARAIMITPNFYELHLRADMYTSRHMQWFYFRITNTKKGFLYRFSITNCSKESSLYNEGMKPLMYSTKDSQLHSIGWRRCGQNITYFSNDNVVPDDPDQQMTYTLSFTVKFPHDDDEVYLAQCYPYTYSDLQDYLSEIATHPIKSTFSSVRLLCKSLAGNNIYYVTITSPAISGENKKKRAVVITARVHPGETPSSWMMKGFLDFLTSDSAPAKELRDKFIFKIVPMLNPDGVIVGNNRCSLSAKDLNRQYRTVMRDAYPSIWYTKLMLFRLLEECGVAMYCDLHAHSRKHNIFIYGCENRRGGDRRLQEQVFPLMLHKNTADKFSFESCKFRVQKSKEGTGRVVMWMMGIANSYTIEASFAGSTLGNRTETHFTTQDYEQMGKSFCQTLLDFYDDDPRKEKLRIKIIDRLTKEGSNADEPTNIRLSDYSSDEGASSSTSDEVGRDDDIVIPNVPPPSPAIDSKKLKPKLSSVPKSKLTKSSSAKRKPLPICKATLKLSLSEKECTDSDSSSCSETEIEKIAALRRRRKQISKKNKKPLQDYSDSEIQTHESRRVITVFDLIPGDNLRSDLCAGRPKAQPKIITDKKCQTTRQLTEVQAKLFTLKNKLWFGTGNGDSPISWGNCSTSPKKKKCIVKKKKRQEKVEKVNNKETKSKIDQTEKSTKNQNGYNIITITFASVAQIKTTDCCRLSNSR
ncbi:cytosolic carboxypeptidase Nna1-like isoform X2 [Anoplophora glabripennis]|uniref:cytosolic carboxypeptidase Nna1-like isoform X2 n=1 Tax=Anoplophora glabripennis TaxID=217634 RepID=UPI000C7948E0|nr:cytosolic carboxypeptidase Nna1-like isoform X2 [Anoplophora glabripennis]